MSSQDDRGWNPYFAGALTGVLIVFSALLTGNYFGASSTFVRAAGMVERIFDSGHVAGLSYFGRYLPRIDWQALFLVGVFAGALVSAARSREFSWQGVPGMWETRFGPGRGLRAAVSFAGGVVILFGARIAGG